MKTVRASSAGFPCNRKIWYEVNDYEREHGENRILETGTCLEPKIVEFLRRDGWIVDYNEGSQNAPIELFYDLQGGRLAGHYDCFISKGEMQNVLADIKTMNDRNFKIWRRNGSLKAHAQYVDQLHVYAGSAIHAGFTVEHLAIVGFNKNDSTMYIDIFDYDPERFKTICQRSQEIINSETAPVEDCPRESWCCRYCGFSDICELNQRFVRKDAPNNEDIVITDDTAIIEAMQMLQEAREYSHAGAALEKQAKLILDEAVYKKGITSIQGGDYSLRITEQTRKSFDTNLFKKAHPELVSSFMKTSTSAYYNVERLDAVYGD